MQGTVDFGGGSVVGPISSGKGWAVAKPLICASSPLMMMTHACRGSLMGALSPLKLIRVERPLGPTRTQLNPTLGGGKYALIRRYLVIIFAG